MSKELTPLEALESLTEYLTGDYRDCFEELSIIETALKELEEIEYHNLKVRDLDKKLKAFEVFKENIECVRTDIGVANSKDNVRYQIIMKPIPQDKYNSIEEALL